MTTRQWRQDSPFGPIRVVTRDVGVREICLPDDDLPTDADDGRPVRDVQRQLDQWFAGSRHEFDLALDLDGVDGFRRTVLETLVAKVGWGETVSYGELAEM